MGFQISVYTFDANVRPRMANAHPFDGGKFVGDEKFMRLLDGRASRIYLADPYAPVWYYRPQDHDHKLVEMIREQIPENAEHFIEFLQWLRAHPNTWVEGSH